MSSYCWVFFFSLLRCVWMPAAISVQSGIDHHPARVIQSVVIHFLIVSPLGDDPRWVPRGAG